MFSNEKKRQDDLRKLMLKISAYSQQEADSYDQFARAIFQLAGVLAASVIKEKEDQNEFPELTYKYSISLPAACPGDYQLVCTREPVEHEI